MGQLSYPSEATIVAMLPRIICSSSAPCLKPNSLTFFKPRLSICRATSGSASPRPTMTNGIVGGQRRRLDEREDALQAFDAAEVEQIIAGGCLGLNAGGFDEVMNRRDFLGRHAQLDKFVGAENG